jgi:hypothetical protein
MGTGWFARKPISTRTYPVAWQAPSLGFWVPVGRSDPVFCRGNGASPRGSHDPSLFRPRFPMPHPFHVFFCFFFFFLLLGVAFRFMGEFDLIFRFFFFLLLCFCFSPAFGLDVSAVSVLD